MDSGVVNIFRVLRDPVMAQELERLLWLTPFARDEFALSYEVTDDPIENARRLVTMSFLGFGSDSVTRGCKTGFRSRGFRNGTTPAIDWARYPNQIELFIKRFQGVVIENRPALDIIATFDREDTLFYVDPPYVQETRGSNGKKHAYRYEMTDENHQEMAKALHQAKGRVVLSGYDCDLYRDLFENWHKVSMKTFADGAQARTECLWLSPNSVWGLQGKLFE